MTRLSASLVVDLIDKTGAKTSAVIGNMSRLQRAERDLMLANRGVRLSNRDRAMERMMIEKEADVEARRQRYMVMAGRVATGTLVAGYAAGKAYANFADLESRVNRIMINADKGVGSIQPTIQRLQKVAADTALPFAEIVSGLETLVASGRSLDEALAFLPSVAVTAQASGAAMADTALSADALAGSLKISSADMQRAFDILVAGGKAGKFELKDMAQYLPSLLPAFAALGYEGTEGLQKVVAMLQMVRNQAGSSSEAATGLSNVFQKMNSVETAKKFKDFGIDITKALEKAKREGRDVLDVFLDMTMVATKGDLSKLTRLFTDAEMQKGVRALITQREELKALTTALGQVDGSTLRDFIQATEISSAKIQRMSNLWQKFVEQVGSGVATVANPALQTVTDQIDGTVARWQSQSGMSEAERNEERNTFARRYLERNPGAWGQEVNAAYMKAQEKKGRGEEQTVFAELNRQDRAEKLEEFYRSGKARSSTGRHNIERLGVSSGRIPVPGQDPRRGGGGRRSMAETYSHGTGREYAAGAVDVAADWGRRNRREMLRNADLATLGMDGMFGAELEAGATKAAEKMKEGGGQAGQATVDAIKAQASALGQAIGQSAASAILAALTKGVPGIIANSSGRSTGDALRDALKGRHFD